ncbi:hypothetical protein SH668x_001112 [Planctomicrobium sp. SH668]|uniref:hypothetical protein n=1 Tax=Planctomicrobium sp. SH668 TaxID=3448126 RepID=UPI003F5B508D
MDSQSRPEISNELDFIEEIRLRTWARNHYAPQGERNRLWHPIVLDEMHRKDGEQSATHHSRK